MDRSELVARLRELYVAHKAGSDGWRKRSNCSWCDTRMARVMEAVDKYVAALSPGSPATRYRQGSIIRQAMPHGSHPSGAKRWRVWGIQGSDYLLGALFSDGSPMTSLWNVGACEAATELEWQDDETGRIS